MRVDVELVDAFETVAVELPEKIAAWFEREAASKKVTLQELLSTKTAGLTVAQLEAVRRRYPDPADVSDYVFTWILRQKHEIVDQHIPTAPREEELPTRRAPVQGDRWEKRPGTIPWEVHLQAWKGYAEAGHGDQSAERVAERRGFSYREVQCALLGHYNECGPHHDVEHPPVPGWEPA